ncbi:MAG: hypothetical protein PHT62_07955 [Desulfotomaculaceae bacterium]|nr:hypothetical protein [Desulfotomaculaceae bacterium]
MATRGTRYDKDFKIGAVKVFSNTLVLRRKGKKDFKIAIEINDVKNMNLLKRDGKSKVLDIRYC